MGHLHYRVLVISVGAILLLTSCCPTATSASSSSSHLRNQQRGNIEQPSTSVPLSQNPSPTRINSRKEKSHRSPVPPIQAKEPSSSSSSIAPRDSNIPSVSVPAEVPFFASRPSRIVQASAGSEHNLILTGLFLLPPLAFVLLWFTVMG